MAMKRFRVSAAIGVLLSKVSEKAQALYFRSLIHLALTDIGELGCALGPEDMLALRAREKETRELEVVGLWKGSEHGPLVAGYFDDNPSGAEIEARREATAERMRKHRRAHRVTPSHSAHKGRHSERTDSVTPGVTESAPPSALPLSDLDLNSSSDPESSSALSSSPDLTDSARKSATRAKRSPDRHPVPEPFPVSEVLAYGRSKGLDERTVRSQCEALVLWAKGAGARKADWIATAQGWLRRYAEEQAGRNPPGASRHATQRAQDRSPASYPMFRQEAPLRPEERVPLADIEGMLRGIGRAVPT